MREIAFITTFSIESITLNNKTINKLINQQSKQEYKKI